jgi:hypothetical protein
VNDEVPMREIVQRYPGKTAADIFARAREQVWARRREISSSDLVAEIFRAIRWDERTLRASGSKRIMLFRCNVAVEVSGDQLTVRLEVPVRLYEDRYADRLAVVMRTLFIPGARA